MLSKEHERGAGLPKDQKADLARYVEKRRESLKLSAAQAARTAGISASKWSQVENAKGGTPTRTTLAKMAAALRLSPSVLFELAGYEFEEDEHEPEPLTTDAPSLEEKFDRLVARLEAAGLLPPEPPDERRDGPGAVYSKRPGPSVPRTRRKGSHGRQ